MASSSTGDQPSTVWLINSECSNHMTRDKLLFNNLDESLKVTVRLGDDKEMKVCGVRTMNVKTKSGTEKRLHGVQYVPGLAHNLLSVGVIAHQGILSDV